MGRLAALISEDFPAHDAQVVHVEEWGFDIYVFPLTIGQYNAIEREGSDSLRAARTIVARGKQADGSPLFDEEDYKKMVSHARGPKFGPAVIARVAAEIMTDSPATAGPGVEEEIDDAEKR